MTERNVRQEKEMHKTNICERRRGERRSIVIFYTYIPENI